MNRETAIALAKQAGWNVEHTATNDYLFKFAELVAVHERERCCTIVYAQCSSDNVAQRTVDAIRGKT